MKICIYLLTHFIMYLCSAILCIPFFVCQSLFKAILQCSAHKANHILLAGLALLLCYGFSSLIILHQQSAMLLVLISSFSTLSLISALYLTIAAYEKFQVHPEQQGYFPHVEQCFTETKVLIEHFAIQPLNSPRNS